MTAGAAVVTLSASYGALGSLIGPRVAERLEVPFLDRAIPAEVAQHLAVSLDEAEIHDERANFASVPILVGALHVRLDGPVTARRAQLRRLGGLSERDAERYQRDADRAREAYVKHFYHRDPADPRLYHLILDSTILDQNTCVELITTAACARKDGPTPRPEDHARGAKQHRLGVTGDVLPAWGSA